MVDVVEDAWIQTFSGQKLFLCHPDPKSILIGDIAHALSNQCRFGGSCSSFYSVAQHCSLVYDLGLPVVEQSLRRVKLAGTLSDFALIRQHQDSMLALLLHDAAEAYLGDISRPLRTLLPKYNEIEANMINVIFNVFGLHPYDSYKETIELVDDLALKIEAQSLMPSKLLKEWGYDINDSALLDIVPYTPERARNAFLSRFNRVLSRRMSCPHIINVHTEACPICTLSTLHEEEDTTCTATFESDCPRIFKSK